MMTISSHLAIAPKHLKYPAYSAPSHRSAVLRNDSRSFVRRPSATLRYPKPAEPELIGLV
jgi:hypothetical protein